jgi:hypothetical protein
MRKKKNDNFELINIELAFIDFEVKTKDDLVN